MNERLRAALARRIASHNRLVRLSALWSALMVAAMWLAIYFISQWLLLFLASAARGIEGDLPTHFRRFFLIGAALWFAAFWVAQMRETADLADDRSVRGTFADLLLLPPRVTLATIRSLDRLVHLSPVEIDRAAGFLASLVRAGKVPASRVADELPGDEESRLRLLAALRQMDLIYVRQPRDGEQVIVPTDPQRLLAFL